jgi:hypothetical protein
MIVAFFYAGKKIPVYQVKHLLDFQKRFSTIDLYFITDSDHTIKYLNNLGIKTFFYDIKKSDLNALTHYKLNNDLLSKALVRFYGLQALMAHIQKPMILVESDVWIANNFPFNKFMSLNHEMAYPLLYKGSAIASTVFFRDRKSVNNFIKYIEKELSVQPSLTDMQLLWGYQYENESRVVILPTSINCNAAFNSSSEAQVNSKISENITLFGGLFDGATWGQFITGEDPRNLLGIQRIYHRLRHHSVNPQKYRIYINNSEEIEVKIESIALPLYSLHIHSKDVNYFTEHQFEKISARISGIRESEKYEFHLQKGLQGIRKESVFNFKEFIKELLFRPFD